MIVNDGNIKSIKLRTGYDNPEQKMEAAEKLDLLSQSLLEADVKLEIEFDEKIHDRQVTFSNGWVVKIGRGLDMFQKPENFYAIGNFSQEQKKCLETIVDIFKK